MILQLLGFAPDADPVAVPATNQIGSPVRGIIASILTNCSGVVPSLRGLKGAPSPASTPLAALANTCQGAAVLAKLDASTRFFAGSATKLYEAATSVWSDVSRAAAYTPNSTQRWRFAQFGNVSLAANGADTIQASVSTGAFSCISGAPVAAVVETVGAFVFGFNTSTNAHGWQCAGINGYTSWTTSIATQAASGVLTATPGPILAGRRFGAAVVAYKKNSMYLGYYVGPPNIWQFDQIPGNAGAMSQEAVVNIGTPDNPKHIFMGEDNFYIFDGAKPVPIGTNRIKQQVFNALLQSRYYACAALHDRVNNRVYFYYPVADSVLPDHCVVYNYRTDKWGQDDRQIEVPVEYVTPGITYDSLGNTYSTYNDLPSLPYDVAFLNSAQPLPGIFDTSHNVKSLTGVAGNTSFTSGDVGNDVNVLSLSRVRPRWLTAPTTASLVNSYRMNTGDSLTTDATTSLSSSNTFDVMRDARWHRFQQSMTGDWELAVLDVEVEGASLE